MPVTVDVVYNLAKLYQILTNWKWPCGGRVHTLRDKLDDQKQGPREDHGEGKSESPWSVAYK